MIEQGLFKRHFVGRDGFIWWIGQIADDSWTQNLSGSRASDTTVSDAPGFGYRYQVRIMGYHTADDNELRDEDLPWAAVMYPVTSGGGGDASFETPALRKGNFVYGFFLDGEDAQQPVIMGILGYNQYQAIYKDKPRPFVPFRGYNNTSPVSTYGITSSTETNPVREDVTKTPDNANRGVGTPSSSQNNNAARDIEKQKGNEKQNLNKPYVCENSKSPGQIQKDIQKMIQNIQNARSGLKNFKKSITHPIQFEGQQVSIQDYIEIQVDRASRAVSGWIRDRIAGAQEWITRKINNGLKDLYFLLFPDKQSDAKAAVETAMDLLACLFKKIIKNLLNIVRKALLTVVDTFINVPLCAAENILAAILGKLTGLINAAVAAILAPLEVIFGAIDLVGDVLGFIEGILSFLSCEEKPECPQIESWSLWDGADIPSTTFDPTSLINKVKDFASSVTQAIDPDNFDFDLDFSDIFSDTCGTDAILCGPPNVVFWGGSGSGATGNVIVSAVGDILGVDITNSGFGYGTRSPFINFEDSCGRGVGAYGTPILGPVSLQSDGTYQPDPNGTETGVTGIIVEDPGYGYLTSPDGSFGGDGRTWSDSNQTTVQRSNGTWDIPYDVGENIQVFVGDTIRTPFGSFSEIVEDNQSLVNSTVGAGLDSVTVGPSAATATAGSAAATAGGVATAATTGFNVGGGLGGTTARTVQVPGGVQFTVPFNGSITAPDSSSTSIVNGEYPIKDTEQYPVILYLCDAIIKNSGVGYQDGDKIVIEPSYGAEMVPTFNELGQLTSVKVVSGGEGILENPKIYIESETGFNAEIIPRFCIDRVGTDEIREPTIQDKIITVIDCVGKN